MFNHEPIRKILRTFIVLNGVFVLIAFLLGRQLGQSYHVNNSILSIILPLAGLAEMWGQIILFYISRLIVIKTKWLPSHLITRGSLAIVVSLSFIMIFVIEGLGMMILTAMSMPLITILHIVVVSWIALSIACTVFAIRVVSERRVSDWIPILSVSYGAQMILLVLWKMTF